MNKKIFFLSSLIFLTSSFSFAELYPETRFFEVCFDTNILLNQNAVTANDILKETVTIDLTEIAKNMSDDGFVINAGIEPLVYVKMNIGGWGAGISLDFDNSLKFSLGKDFFELLGEGNADTDTISTTVSMGAQSFIKAAVPLKFRFGKLRFRVAPTVFVPVFYIPYNTSSITGSVKESNGEYTVGISGEFNMYTLLNISALTGGSFDFSSLLSDITSGTIVEDLFSSAGINLDVGVEFPLFRTLDVGAYGVIPVIPGHLKYCTSAYADYSISGISVTNIINGTTEFTTPEYGTHYGFNSCSELNSAYSVNTPFRIGIEGAWRPFGAWCTFRPKLGVAVNNPFGEDTQGWENFKEASYVEYALGADIRILYILNFYLNTQYVEQIYTNSFGLGMNLRLFELTVNVASSSSDFAKSWLLSGVDASVGIRTGF